VDTGVNENKERLKERKKDRKKERKMDSNGTELKRELFLKEAMRRFDNSEACCTGSRSPDDFCLML
jgi:hypothetical protein